MWLAAVIIAFAHLPVTGHEPARVLLLHSFGRQFAPYNLFSEWFRTELAQQLDEPVEFHDVPLGSARFLEALQDDPLADYLTALFSGRRLNLVVPIGGPAVRFAQRYRQRLFPSTPMILACVDRRLLQSAGLSSNDTVVAVTYEPARIIENMIQILPGTTNVVVVFGSSPVEKFWVSEMRREFQWFTNRIHFEWFNELPFTEMCRRVTVLPKHSAIFYALLSVDAEGVPQEEERALAMLHQAANAPIFGTHDGQMGKGIVGGPLMAVEGLSRKTAEVAVRILHGEMPGEIKSATQTFGKPVYDWRELRRWEISEARLPMGSEILFHQPSVWEIYKWRILALAALCFIEATLIILLLVHRGKRQRAEISLRRAEASAHELSGRLIHAQEQERARLAKELHDGLSQNLALLAVELDLFGQKPSETPDQVSQRMQEFSGRTKDLSGEVHRLSHGLHPAKLEQLGLTAAIRGFCRELEGGGGVSVHFTSGKVPRVLPGDLALCLYRVTQEALQNVVKHSGAKNATVDLRVVDEEIQLKISDDGKGFDPTTEPASGALGLVSMRERVRLLHGDIWLDSKPGQGTKVELHLPLATQLTVASRPGHGVHLPC